MADTKRLSADKSAEVVTRFWKRFNLMDSSRADREAEWKYSDLQTEAKIVHDER